MPTYAVLGAERLRAENCTYGNSAMPRVHSYSRGHPLSRAFGNVEVSRKRPSTALLKEMLSDHSTRRDHYGIPIVGKRIKIGLAEDSLSSEENLAENHWNEPHRSLTSITASVGDPSVGDPSVRDLQQRTEFLENWLVRYLKPMNHPFVQQPVDQNIDAINDISAKSEIAALKDREQNLKGQLAGNPKGHGDPYEACAWWYTGYIPGKTRPPSASVDVYALLGRPFSY
jgi:hypothetical protein